MKYSLSLFIALAACSNLSYAMRGVPREEQEASMYGRNIKIKNESDYPITASVNNENRSGSSTGVVIPAHGENSILVNTGRAVTLTADVNGKKLKHHFHRNKNTENMWEVDIRKGLLFEHIEITRRISDLQAGISY